MMLYEYIWHNTLRGHDVYVLYIDISKAFDTVDHNKLIAGVRDRLKLPKDCRFLHYLNNMYQNLNYQVKVGDVLSDIMRQELGIKQGCTLSPTLYVAYHNSAIEAALEVTIPERNSTIVSVYADDTALAARNTDTLSKMFSATLNEYETKDLRCNFKKTFIVRYTYKTVHGRTTSAQASRALSVASKAKVKSPKPLHITLKVETKLEGKRDVEIQVVDSVTYLGEEMHKSLMPNLEKERRRYHAVANKYRDVVESTRLPPDLVCKMMNTYVLPELLPSAALYGMLIHTKGRPATAARMVLRNIQQYTERIAKIHNRAGVPLKNTAKELQFHTTGIINPEVFVRQSAVHHLLDVLQKDPAEINTWLASYFTTKIHPRSTVATGFRYLRPEHLQNTPIIATLKYIAEITTATVVYNVKKQRFYECRFFSILPTRIQEAMTDKCAVAKAMVYDSA